jgi:hypothetical protein
MGSGDVYDVFISYARSDGGAASELNVWLCAPIASSSAGTHLSPGRSTLRSKKVLKPCGSKELAILAGSNGIDHTE